MAVSSVALCALASWGCDSKETEESGSTSGCQDTYLEDDVYAFVQPTGGVSSSKKLGHLKVRYTVPGQGGIEAKLYLDAKVSSLDDKYDFMWVNVLVGMTEGGTPVTSKAGFFTSLPWIDPNPNATISGVTQDAEPFYFNVGAEFDQFHGEGSWTDFNDSPARASDVTMSFNTFLVSVEEWNHFSLCVLEGFAWTWSGSDDCVSNVYWLGTGPDTINQAISNGVAAGPGAPEAGGYLSYYAYSGFLCDHVQTKLSPPKGGDVLLEFLGAAKLDLSGAALSGAFDYDHDGVPAEFVIGERGANAGGLLNSGSARIVSALSGATLLTWGGAGAEDAFGASAAVVGDTDGDGYAEILVGAPQADLEGGTSGAGYAVLFSGATGMPSSQWTGDFVGQQFGSAASGVGDVDLDGFADFMIGAPAIGALSQGKAVVLSGSDGAVLRSTAGASGEMLGFAVGGMGDVDVDGVPDTFVSAPSLFTFHTGYARIESGASGNLLGEVSGDQSSEGFGLACANVGDLDGDGLAELAVGAPFWSGASPSMGVLRVYSPGTPAAAVPIWSATGEAAYACLGASVCGVGDFDADQAPDLAIGAPQADLQGHSTGAGFVQVRRGDGTLLATLRGDTGYDLFGMTVAPAGDLDGDGGAELLVGAPLADTPAFNSGLVQVLSQNPCGAVVPAETVVRNEPPNPVAFLPGPTQPVIGTVWSPVIDHATFLPAAVFDFVAITASPASVPLGDLGVLLCSPPFLVQASALAGSPFVIPVPANCAFAGIHLCTQGASLDAQGKVQLTNALDITLGNS